MDTSIAIIGGGNIGTQFACVCASKGYKVNIFSSKPDLFSQEIEMIDEYEKVTVGVLNKVSADLREVVDDCNVIFISYPAFLLKDIASQLLPFIRSGMDICILPGTGGAEFAFRECIKAGASLYGIQRVPSVARLEQYGNRVRCEGLRSELCVAAIPSNKATDFAHFLQFLFGIRCVALPNYLSVTLTPSNPILHTTRLRTLFSDYKDGVVYKRNPLFYGEWSDSSSELLIACDDELQAMLRNMDKIDLSSVHSLKQHYGSNTVKAMTEKICSIKSLHNLKSPMKQVEGGWIPDFSSRYFTADFPYGLAILVEIAEILGVSVPKMTDTLKWYGEITGDKSRFELESFGIKKTEDIYGYYF